jgi:hypothetical protein
MQIGFGKDEIRELAAAVAGEMLRQQMSVGAVRPIYPHEDVAKMLGVSNYQLHEWRKKGLIKGSRIGKGYTYLGSELLRVMAENEVDGL